MEFIYHERQEGQLCARHCINNLLQAEYFTEFDLASIAKDLDQKERETMAEGGTNREEYQKFISNPSKNMDDTGFFSIQVITNALKVLNLEIVPFNSSDQIATSAQSDPTTQKAYICNYKQHWLTIRKIGQQWFNLNSLLTGPELISKTYLQMFLKQLQNEGYFIFIVAGNLPRSENDEILSNCIVSQTVKPKIMNETQSSSYNIPSTSSGYPNEQDYDNNLELAIEKILIQNSEENDKNLQKAINLSIQESNLKKVSKLHNSLENLTDDELLEKAIKMSMENHFI